MIGVVRPLRIGIDVGGTKIEGILMDGSTEVARVRVPTPRQDYAATLDAIAAVVEELEGGARDTATVGIGIPGVISPQTGRVKNANSTWLNGRPLLHDLQVRLSQAVRIENDANCFAVSEAVDGAAAGAAVVFGVIIGTGVGGGLVVRGELIAGANAIAGEWGHNPLPWPRAEEEPGPECDCGQRGCIETFLSGPALEADHERRTGHRETTHEIARRGGEDEDADTTLRLYETRLARALAAVINIVDPDVIVLGGGMSNIERFYENVPRLWTSYVFGTPREPVTTPLAAARHGCGPLDTSPHIFKYIYVMPPSELQALKADLFRALAHPTRIAVLELLAVRERTVQELQDALGLDQPAVSQHLAALRSRLLVSSRKEGTLAYYTLRSPLIVELLRASREFLSDRLTQSQLMLRALRREKRR